MSTSTSSLLSAAGVVPAPVASQAHSSAASLSSSSAASQQQSWMQHQPRHLQQKAKIVPTETSGGVSCKGCEWLKLENTREREKTLTHSNFHYPPQLLDLKAALFAQESALRHGVRLPRVRPEKSSGDTLGSANRGLSERQARDTTSSAAASKSGDSAVSSEEYDRAYANLSRKALVYEKLVSSQVGAEGQSGAFLVDFERKGWQRQDEQEESPHHVAAASRSNQSTYDSSSSSSSSLPVPMSDTSDPYAAHLASQRADWERAALADIAASRDDDGPLNEFEHSGPRMFSATTKDALREIQAQTNASREARVEEIRTRKHAVQERRDAIDAKERRKKAFLEEHTKREGGWSVVER